MTTDAVLEIVKFAGIALENKKEEESEEVWHTEITEEIQFFTDAIFLEEHLLSMLVFMEGIMDLLKVFFSTEDTELDMFAQ